jgi:hypothetical protein
MERRGKLLTSDDVGRLDVVERLAGVGRTERRGEVERSDDLLGIERRCEVERMGDVERREAREDVERGDLLLSDSLGVLASFLNLIDKNVSLSIISFASGDSSANIKNPASSKVARCSIASGKGELDIIFELV